MFGLGDVLSGIIACEVVVKLEVVGGKMDGGFVVAKGKVNVPHAVSLFLCLTY